MKRLFVSITVVLVAVLTSNAQYFVAGSVGMDFSSGKYKSGGTSTDKPSTFMFEIWPAMGYFLNDNFAIGLEAGIERSVRNYKNDSKRKVFNTTLGLGILGIYKLVEVNDLAFILKGSLGYQSSKEKYKTGSTSNEDDPTNGIGFFVLPVLSYSLTERFSVEAYCDFLRFGFYRESQKSGNRKDIDNYFGFGVNYGDSEVFNNSLLSVGIVYKF